MGESSINVTPAKATAGNILTGSLVLLASTTQTAFLTIPAGQTWFGSITVMAASTATVASTQNCRVVTAGTGVLPAAATMVAVALASRDTSPGMVTIPNVTVIAPSGNTVTLELLNSTATTFGGAAVANGVLL